jgi:hypothetical protein
MSEISHQVVGAAQDEDLSALRITVPPTHQNIALEDLVLRHNVRDASEYNLPPLVESIKRNGYRPSAPIVVHIGNDGVNEVLAGNRRTNSLMSLQPVERATALAATGGLVPCIVYKGLTPAQIELLRCDHGSDEDREPLSKYGTFVAVSRLLIAGLSQAAIAIRLGMYIVKDNVKKPNRSQVQIFTAAAALPERIREMLKSYWLKGIGPIKHSDIMPLSKIWNEEWTSYGINGQEGPQFRAKVDEILAREAGTPIQTTKTLTANAATEKAKVMSSPTTRQLLVAATAADGSKLAELDRQLCQRDAMIRQFDWLMQHKTKQITKLLEEAKEALAQADIEEENRRKAAAEAARQQATPVVTAPPTLPA